VEREVYPTFVLIGGKFKENKRENGFAFYLWITYCKFYPGLTLANLKTNKYDRPMQHTLFF
jgi:hypothetical protein